METKPFGWTGVPVPIIGQGTWHMGGAARQRASEAAALRLGLELGLTHIDTAEAYSSGGAEEVIAGVIRERRRGDLFLVSKVMPEHATRPGTIRAAEQSLRRLGTDYLDLYLLHWPGRHPIGETMAAMEDLVAAGKIRYVGVSNFDVEAMRAAMAALTRQRLACNQVLYNLARREIEADLVPFCARHGIAVVGYTPFGRFPRPGGEGYQLLADIGARHGKTPRQVALRFLSRQPNLFAIPKASDPAHVRENAGAGDFTLSDPDVTAIDQAFRVRR